MAESNGTPRPRELQIRVMGVKGAGRQTRAVPLPFLFGKPATIDTGLSPVTAQRGAPPVRQYHRFRSEVSQPNSVYPVPTETRLLFCRKELQQDLQQTRTDLNPDYPLVAWYLLHLLAVVFRSHAREQFRVRCFPNDHTRKTPDGNAQSCANQCAHANWIALLYSIIMCRDSAVYSSVVYYSYRTGLVSYSSKTLE